LTDFIEYRLMEPIVAEIARQAKESIVTINMGGLIEMLIADTSEHFELTDIQEFGGEMAETITRMIVQTTGSFTDPRYHVPITYYFASRLGLSLIGVERKSHTVANGNEPYSE